MADKIKNHWVNDKRDEQKTAQKNENQWRKNSLCKYGTELNCPAY